jgi:arylsulfatase A-like enzyme
VPARLVVLAVLALLSACKAEGDRALPRPEKLAAGANIVLITVDTTRRDHIGCYGRTPSPTPNLDRICAAGQRLDAAIAVGPVTLPTHASMFTGLYPTRHGARYNGVRRLGPGHPTLAEQYAAAGYHTAAFVAAFVLDRRYGLARGFAHYDDAVGDDSAAFAGRIAERDARAVTDSALAWLSAHGDDRPVLLWAHYYDPHLPYVRRDQQDVDDAAAYVGEIAHMDAQIGRLLAHPRLAPERTVIVVLADHGEALGDHGEDTHGLFIYDSTVAIPWIIAAPGLPAGSSAALASQVDLMPTLLALSGLPIPPGLDGRSLFDRPRAPNDAVFIETALPYFDFRLSALHALRTPDAKYIEAPRPEFYRLSVDPAERDNLVAEGLYPDDAANLAERLDALLAAAPALNAPAADASVDDAEGLARLRSLGYLAGDTLGTELADPKDALPLVRAQNAAQSLAAAGRHREAIAALDGLLADAPGATGARLLRARLLALVGRRDEAERDVREVNATRPSADSLLLQAQLAVIARQLDDARVLLDEARRLEPDHGGVLIVLGDIELELFDIDAARSAYEQALAVDPVRVGRQARARIAGLPDLD